MGPLVDAHRRPVARIVEGQLAAVLGATSMIDVSDGLGIDLGRIADASGVGFALDDVPIAGGASEEDAIGGGEDYELVFSVPPDTDIERRFTEARLRRPLRIGEVVARSGERTFRGEVFSPIGWRHQLG